MNSGFDTSDIRREAYKRQLAMGASMVRRFKKKICLIGNGAVGKTSLISRFVKDQFSDAYIMTIGTKVTSKEVPVTLHGDAYNVHLLIWDILGQPQYQKVKTSAYQGAVGALVVSDITQEDSIKAMAGWVRTFRGTVGDRPIIFLANKVDLVDEGEARIQALKAEAAKLGVPFLFTSAKTGQNVELAFKLLGRAVLQDNSTGVPTEPINPLRIKMGPIQLLDKVIDDFCTQNGGQEVSMPTVQEVIEDTGVDLTEPTMDQVRLVFAALKERSAVLAEDGELPSGSDPGLDVGSNYLLLEDRVDEGFRTLTKAHQAGVPVLLLTQTFPNKVLPRYDLQGIQAHWISDSTQSEEAIKPNRLEFEMAQRIFGFLRMSEGRVIFLDCLELLVMENGFEKVMRFLKRVNDHAAVSLSTVVVAASPRGFRDEQMLLLEKEFDFVRDLRQGSD